MDVHDPHLSYDELDSPHELACDCACACDNLHIDAGTPEHLTHLTDCDAVLAICDLHIDASAVKLANSMELHID